MKASRNNYPYLTTDIAKKINKPMNFVAKAMTHLDLKGNQEYHQAIKTSKTSVSPRYSQAALFYLQEYIKDNPNYNPYTSSNNVKNIMVTPQNGMSDS